MKHLFFFPIIIILISTSCKEKQVENKEESTLTSIQAQMYADSVIKQIKHDAGFDTIGISEAPVKILKARLVQEEYSSYKSVQLSYKNVSNKTIAGVKFKWYGENVFNEPADMGSYVVEGFGAGYTDDPIRPGKTQTRTWEVLSRDGKKIVKAWPIEVVFQDGSKWMVGKRLYR